MTTKDVWAVRSPDGTCLFDPNWSRAEAEDERDWKARVCQREHSLARLRVEELPVSTKNSVTIPVPSDKPATTTEKSRVGLVDYTMCVSSVVAFIAVFSVTIMLPLHLATEQSAMLSTVCGLFAAMTVLAVISKHR